MIFKVERRQNWRRIIGLERRGARLDRLFNRPLPNPTQLVDEDFQPDRRDDRDPSGPLHLRHRIRLRTKASPSRTRLRFILRQREGRAR